MCYTHILVATDLAEDCHPVLERANAIAERFDCMLSFLHVVEPMSVAFGADVPMDLSLLQEQQTEQAREKLEAFTAGFPRITPDHCHLRVGQPKHEIHEMAREQKVDLIVVGSHGRHGLALLLGSTTNDVLSKAPCDVLAVALNKQETEDAE